ncbi:MAG: DUF805 domain-containing protein [Alphaproteobacteria bacterium]|nr:DUF805 domain-containing protein [Alphaproteobacteria bacterium]
MGELWAILREGAGSTFMFTGRMKRRPYWIYVLFIHLIWIGASTVQILVVPVDDFAARYSLTETFVNSSVIAIGIWFAITLLSATVRRLHDVARPGSYILMVIIPFGGFYLFYLLSLPTQLHNLTNREILS